MAHSLSSNNMEKSKEAISKIEKRDEQQSASADQLKETSRELVSDIREGVENADVMTNGEVQEGQGEDKKVYNGGTTSGGTQAAQALLAKQVKIPSVEVMRKQVSVEIRKEIRVLEHQAKKIMRNPSKFSPFTLNGVVSKIRELKEILGQLAYATMENLKGWWMKFVKGITI